MAPFGIGPRSREPPTSWQGERKVGGFLVVGRPSGPGTLPFDYFKGRPGTADWQPVPVAAREVFPSVSTIMRQGTVKRA